MAAREPAGFIGLDDDDDHGLERAFGNYFMRKGEGGDSADDRGGGPTPETMRAAMDSNSSQSIWAMGGLQQL